MDTPGSRNDTELIDAANDDVEGNGGSGRNNDEGGAEISGATSEASIHIDSTSPIDRIGMEVEITDKQSKEIEANDDAPSGNQVLPSGDDEHDNDEEADNEGSENLDISQSITSDSPGKNITRAGESQSQESNIIPEAPPQPEKTSDLVLDHQGTDFEGDSSSNPLAITWSFGFNETVRCRNLSTQYQRVVVYTCAQNVILCDFENNRQKILQGHTNNVNYLSVSEDKRWLATSSVGKDSLIIVWDTFKCIPIRSIFNPHNYGCQAIGLTSDAKYLATLSAQTSTGQPQVLAIWDWLNGEDAPLCSVELEPSYGIQQSIYFNQNDSSQLITNSHSRVLFVEWKETGSIKVYAPVLTNSTFNKVVGNFSMSIFVPGSSQALTGTSAGILVVWDLQSELTRGDKSPMNKRALKLLELQPGIGFTVVTTAASYIVTGDTKGHVKFFSNDLQLVYWYSDLSIGPIHSISFEYFPQFEHLVNSKAKYPLSATVGAEKFVTLPFVIATTKSNIGYIDPNGPKLTLISRDHAARIQAITTHPFEPWLVIGSYSGLLKIWNYADKKEVASKYFDKGTLINCCKYDPQGNDLALGFANGVIQLFDGITLRTEDDLTFHDTNKAITKIVFSYDCVFMASADEGFTTSLYCCLNNKWTFIARHCAHYKPIVDIAFGVEVDTDRPRLLTLGEDRMIVEYDLMGSSKDDLQIMSTDRIEQSAVPLSMAWYPPLTKETFIVTANDQYKFKLYNATTKMCRRTILGPSYGSAVFRISILPSGDNNNSSSSSKTQYICYANKSHVGLAILPLDGNCFNYVSTVAHPNGLSDMCSSHDGKYLFTAGSHDSVVNMYRINLESLHAHASLGGEAMLPFYSMLDNGREGQLFKDLEDFFYYSMLRSQGIDTMNKRETSKTIPLTEVPYIMRALGFFPSEQEIDDMLNEVKFSEYVDSGQYKEDIDIEDFLKLYLNHRPAFGLNSQKLKWAFSVLSRGNDSLVDRASLLDLLQSKGEHITEYELAEYLTVLFGQAELGAASELAELDATKVGDLLETRLPYELDAPFFANELLGLDVDLSGTGEVIPEDSGGGDVGLGHIPTSTTKSHDAGVQPPLTYGQTGRGSVLSGGGRFGSAGYETSSS